MIPDPMNHLPDEALNDILIGMGSAEAEKHLSACPVCRGKVEEFRSGLEEFNQTTLVWSEARSNAMERIHARPRSQRGPYTFVGWALTAAVLVAIAVPVLRHNDGFWSNQKTAQVTLPEDSDAQITKDNELLKAVNEAINQDDESLKNEHQLLERPHLRLKARPE